MIDSRYYTIPEWADILHVKSGTIYRWLRMKRYDGVLCRLDEDMYYRIYISEETMDEIITDNESRLDFCNYRNRDDAIEQTIYQLEQLEDSLYNQCLIIEKLKINIEKMGLQ